MEVPLMPSLSVLKMPGISYPLIHPSGLGKVARSRIHRGGGRSVAVSKRSVALRAIFFEELFPAVMQFRRRFNKSWDRPEESHVLSQEEIPSDSAIRIPRLRADSRRRCRSIGIPQPRHNHAGKQTRNDQAATTPPAARKQPLSSSASTYFSIIGGTPNLHCSNGSPIGISSPRPMERRIQSSPPGQEQQSEGQFRPSKKRLVSKSRKDHPVKIQPVSRQA